MKYLILIIITQFCFAEDLPTLNIFNTGDSLWLMVDLAPGEEITGPIVTDDSSVPCKIKALNLVGWKFEKWIYPKATDHYYKELDFSKLVYKDDFIIKTKINALGSSGRLIFNYQSCKGGLCLPPQSVEIKLPIH
jgi:hypothetical protein